MNVIVEGPSDDDDMGSGRNGGAALRSFRGRQNAALRFPRVVKKGETSASEQGAPGNGDVADLGQSASKLGTNVETAARGALSFEAAPVRAGDIYAAASASLPTEAENRASIGRESALFVKQMARLPALPFQGAQRRAARDVA